MFKGFLTILFGPITMLALHGVCAAQSLQEQFLNPPDDSRPMTWMHMLNGNASKEGLEKDLQGLHDAGVGGALIFSLSYHDIPAGKTDFNSPKFRDVIQHGVKVADELGLKLGLHNCDGWSSSGGPWISVEDSMKHLVWSETVVRGGDVDVEMPEPESRHDYYRDIATIAIPASEQEFQADHNPLKITSSHGDAEAAKLFDGDLSNGPEIWFAKGEREGWIQFEYENPFPAQSLRIETSARDFQCKLLSSNDGETFQEVVDMEMIIRPGKKIFGLVAEFEPVNARFYKFAFSEPQHRGFTVHEIDLTPFPRRVGWMAHAGMAQKDGKVKQAIRSAQYADSNFVPMDQVKVFGEDVVKANRLTTQLPDGHWRIMRFGYTSTGAKNHPATAPGLGFECDKLDASALEKHFDAYMKKVIDEAGPLAGKPLLFSEIDSYEMGWQNWTDGFQSLFETQKNYDITPFLPLMAGRFIGDEDTADAVSEDFRAVVTNLMTENYFHRFTQLCHQNKLQSYIEPYGNGPLNNLEIAGRCDIPMAEFWMRDSCNVRAAVQGAHVYGKPIISAESFTSWADLNWKGHPYLMKAYGDRAWAHGINEFMYHRFAHQANPNVSPGMTMGSVGSHIDRTQTWWYNAGKAWNKYNQRGSFMLRQGVPVSDILVYIGDSQPSDESARWLVGVPTGYNLDGCNAEVLIDRVRVENGNLVLPEGTTYRVLMLQNCDKLHLRSLRRLEELAKAGATIVGAMPIQPISYLERQTKSDEFATLAKSMWGEGKSPNKVGKGLVVTSERFPDDPSELGLEPDLIMQRRNDGDFIHRKVGETDIYFVYNPEKTPTTLQCSFRVGDRLPELWDADTGSIKKLAQFVQTNGRTDIAIDLDPSGSSFVVFREPTQGFDPVAEVTPKSGSVLLDEQNNLQLISQSKGKHVIKFASGKEGYATIDELGQPTPLSGRWKVDFDGPGLTGEKSLMFETLVDWKDHQREDIRHFSGTATYSQKMNVGEEWLESGERIYLDLGEVAIAAEVAVNGEEVGTLWKPPFIVDVTDRVKAGMNDVEIRVTNQWANRLIGDQDLDDTSKYYIGKKKLVKKMPAWYVNNEPMPDGPRSTFTTWNFYDEDRELLPSGLLGPVRFVAEAIVPITDSK